MKVVVIAGRQGTRIASVNSEIPKAMIPIDGKPILEYELELAKRYGFTDFLFIIGYLGYRIADYFGDGTKWGVHIDYFREEQPLGTAGAIGLLKDKLTEDFFVFYGDTVMDVDLQAMLEYHKAKAADATLFVHPNDHPYDSDIVDMDEQGRVCRLLLKPHADGFVSRNMVNAALFIFSPKILDVITPHTKCHIEKNVLPACLEQGMNIYGYVSFEYIKDMGTPERYYAVCNDVMIGKVVRLNRRYKRPAVFLDRDGVVNYEVNLLSKPEQVQLIPGAAEAIRYINASGFLAIIVTNQPVIARNLCDLTDLKYIHDWLETLLGRQHAYLNAFYFCPHHPDAGYPEERKEYKIVCNCRKPAPGMLLQAAADWNIDMAHSYMIGDSQRDIQAGERAGCSQSFLIPTNTPDTLLNLITKIL